MKRLLATIRCDVTLQSRNGFYYATALVLICCVAVLSRIPSLNLNWLLPALVLGNLLLNTFYFISGLILLEKGEGTLEAQVVTPLRSWEYLASKVGTLTLLGVVENTVIVMLLVGLNFNLLPLVASLILTAVLYCLVGMIAVIRYTSINEYLMPSLLYTGLTVAPLLPYLAQWDAWFLYLHPLRGTLLLAQAAFQPTPYWQVIYGVLYSTLWIGLLAHLSVRAFKRFIIVETGGV
ncbi:MAG: ABC transporter permease [Acidobacteriota bacterium]